MKIPRCFSFISSYGDGDKVVPSVFLLELLELFGVQHDGTWPSIHLATECWVPGTLQYQVPAQPELEAKAYKASDLLRQLYVWNSRTLSEVEASWIRQSNLPARFVLCGATITAMVKRKVYAGLQWPAGVVCIENVGLGSVRTRDPKLESWEAVQKLPATLKQVEAYPVWYKTWDWPFPPQTEFDGLLGTQRNVSAGDAIDGVMQINVYCSMRPKPNDPALLAKWRPDPGFADTLQTYVRGKAEMGIPLGPGVFILAASQPSCMRFEHEAGKILPAGSQVYCLGYAVPESFTVSKGLNEIGLLVRCLVEWLAASVA